MPEGVGYSQISAKSESARPQQNVSRAEESRTKQTNNEKSSESVKRRDNPAVEVKLSNEARKADDVAQPRQDENTYAALKRKR
ncbi:MAG: hypothetical protein ACJ0Q6_04605 [Candidatus Azotimanducaceae bacterium]|uniref:Uncharacterized protein n=1 Tax=OM182 bacterium TaxID=2510334 RepID=A0A520RYU0_9GAMM|nr:hypothetical protein [Gammaproteobacteria bacterium]RZO75402.1 MAG: hypothetical protein EVA68_07100 [OM182 bacterium]